MINNKKICFISCVNDELLYDECLRYIKNLNIPKGYKIETIGIRKATSITSGYNMAMKQSDAKYKIYIHQDAFILDKDFLSKILEVFKDKSIGLIGTAGCDKLPTNAIWWEGKKCYFNLYDNANGIMKAKPLRNNKEHPKVQSVDGLVMITQYDVLWRDDIFNGWHFYDISQSIEFKRQNYKIVILNTQMPWILHDCGPIGVKNNDQYEKYRNIFLEEYSKDLFPLVSILIPAYNKPEFLEIGLKSVLNQTYKNIEVIICDDSTNDQVENMVKRYLKEYPNIKYRRNLKEKEDIFLKEENDELRNREGNNNAIKNFDRCLRLSSGEYINYLMDDDLFREDKISTMMNYYLEDEEITLVTAYRQLINERGELLKPILATEKLSETTAKLEGKVLIDFILETMLNHIGEPTSVLFKKKDLEGKMFGEFSGKRYYCNIDIAAWMGLLSKGKAVYIPEPLSSMRIHGEQRTNMLSVQILGTIEWFNLIMSSIALGYLKEEIKQDMMMKWVKKNMSLFDLLLANDNAGKVPLEELYDCYDKAFKNILNINS